MNRDTPARLVWAALRHLAETRPPSDARLVKLYEKIEAEVERRAEAAGQRLDAIAAEAQQAVADQLAKRETVGPRDMAAVQDMIEHALDAAGLAEIEAEIRAIAEYARAELQRVTLRKLTKEQAAAIDAVTEQGLEWVDEAPERIATATRESLNLTKPILVATFAAAFVHHMGVWTSFTRLSVANAMRRVERRTLWEYGQTLQLPKGYYAGPLDPRTRTICGNADQPPYGMAKRAWPVEALAQADNGFDSARIEDDCGGPLCRHRLRPVSEAFMPERQVTDYHMETREEAGRTVTFPVADGFDYETWLASVADDTDFETDQRPITRRLAR